MTICLSCILSTLALLIASNGAPVLANKFYPGFFNRPVDLDYRLNDGQRLFGKSKTWRGVCSSVFFTSITALVLGFEFFVGASFAVLAMTGDILASFIKRRLGLKESSRARALDRIPESLFPIWLLNEPLALGLIDMALIVFIFFLIEEFFSPILYKLHLRMRPY